MEPVILTIAETIVDGRLDLDNKLATSAFYIPSNDLTAASKSLRNTWQTGRLVWVQ